MKLNQVITGCALAAGLMAVAASSQAGVVIGNTLYAPAKIKAKLTYVDGDKYKSMSVTDKDLLETWGLDAKGNQIATQVSGSFGGLYVINSKANDVVADLVYEELAWINVADYIWTESEKNNSYKYSEQGYMDTYFYDYTGEYEAYLNLYGNYKADYKENWNNNNNDYNASFKLSLKNAQAEWYDDSTGDYNPGTGSISANGNGKLTYVE